MAACITDLPISGPFSADQTQYLQGFFAGAMQRAPFVGQTTDGAITQECESGVSNLGEAAVEEPTFWGTAVSELCAEEVWKYERNPLDA